ncbi:MAG TPA: hypothetical protein ENN35_00915 [Deltaproteobacteria bacterium]|nr:hypothetical protein [Deltaproteobacteria bacterium]
MKLKQYYTTFAIVAVMVLLAAFLVVSCMHVSGSGDKGQWNVEGWDQKWCPLCGMDLDVFHSTCHRLFFNDGRIVGYCSIHCAAKDYRKYRDQVAKIDVADFATGEFIPAETAHYLVGSDLPGVMSVVSKKAFASLDDAKKFQKEHGGDILSFKETLAVVYAGIDRDQKMLMKKMGTMEVMGKKVATKYGCFECHGQDGRGCGKATAFISPRFVKEMNSKPVLKDAIMRDGHAKDAFQDKISPKELQALMIYVWGVKERAK